ncbi:MAG: glycosyltransferase family A protein [FCB group bacterium]|jgi:GT2 family glycosyltransferase|nr:glycosyltransferase family A protein [FCB group bacterium]
MEKRECTVIVPTRCGANLLPLPLAHLEVQSFPSARFEVIVIDYGDASQPADLLERYSAGAPVRTRCLSLPESTAAKARNVAASEAEGRWLLFLDEDLLAGPQLVEAHVRAQELHGSSQVRGRVQMHPQVDSRLLTKRFRICPEFPGASYEARLMDFGFHNLSVPRSVFTESGGFDESLDFDGLEDLVLGWRLWDGGIKSVYAEDAAAYSWRSTRPLEERQRHYRAGYSLHSLFAGEVPEEVRKRFPLVRTRLQESMDGLMQPVYRHLCDSLAEGSRPFGAMFDRMLRFDFRRGYRDALAGRPPQFEGRSAFGNTAASTG